MHAYTCTCIDTQDNSFRDITSVKQADEAVAERSGSGRDLVTENRRLRAENHQLRLEREILKKATAFFARENG